MKNQKNFGIIIIRIKFSEPIENTFEIYIANSREHLKYALNELRRCVFSILGFLVKKSIFFYKVYSKNFKKHAKNRIIYLFYILKNFFFVL